MATQKEVIQAFMNSLDTTTNLSGEEALDAAIKACSTFKSFAELKTSLIRDCQNAQSGEDFLKTYCGIDYSNDDSGAIIGFEAGGTEIKNDADLIPENGSLDKNFSDNFFTVNDLEVELENKTFDNLSDSEKFIWQGLKTWWIKNALDVIAESYGDNFSFGENSSAMVNKMLVQFTNDASNNAPASTTYWWNNSSGRTVGLRLIINMHYWNSIEDDVDEANSSFDRVIAHELTHAVMDANILPLPVLNSLPNFVKEGLSELTVGIKNSRADLIKNLADDAGTFETGLVLENEDTSDSFMYEGGFIFFRYLARQASDFNISNRTANTLIQTFRGNDTIQNYADNVTIDGGSGGNSIYNYSKKVSIVASADRDYIASYSESNNVTISGGAGNSFINNWGNSNQINTGDGDDTIYNSSLASNSYIAGGADNDSIVNYAGSVTLDGGTGYDKIQSNGNNVTVLAGAGNDSVSLESGENISVDAGNGNDYVRILSGAKKATVLGGNGNDTVDGIAQSGFVNLGAGNDSIQTYADAENSTIYGDAGKDSIYTGAQTAFIDAGADDDYIHIYSNAINNTIAGGTGNDLIQSYNTNGVVYLYAAGDGNDTIKGFTEKDTLSISGISSSQKSGDDVIISVGNDSITLTDAASLFSDTTLIVTNSTASPITIGAAVEIVDATARTTAAKITGNALDNTIFGGTGKDTLYGADGNDYLIGGAGADKLYGQVGEDTLWGGIGNDTLKGGDGDDLFIYTAGNDVITDYEVGDKISLSAAISKASVKGSDATFTIGSNTLTVKDGMGKEIVFINADGTERTIIGGAYLATDATTSKTTLAAWREVGDASERTKAINLSGNALDNTLFGGSGKDTLYGADGNDYLVGGAGADKLYGQVGDDTLWGGTGNDTLKGGDGDDLFIYTAGNDFITDYEVGDKISLSAAISKSSVKGSDATFTIGSNTLTIKDGMGKEIVFINADGTERTIIGGAYLATDATTAKTTLAAWREVGDASERTKAINLTGNALANTLFGGSGKDTLYGADGDDYLEGNAGADKLYGQVGDDTLWGGTGNDTLKGGDGDDVFIYNPNEGTDTIVDYQSGELLQITDGTFSKAAYSSGTLTLTIDDGGSVLFKNVTTSTEFNINGKIYHVSGNTIK